MTDQHGADRDLEQRVHTLESEVAELREQVARSVSDAEAARVLATGADRDASEVRAELRAHTRSLSALRESQLEMNAKLGSLDGRFAVLGDSVERRFVAVDSGIQQITAMLQTLIDRDGRANGSA